MKRKNWVRIVFFFALSTQLFVIQAQKIEKKYTFQWTAPLHYEISEDKSVDFPHFDQAIYTRDFPTLPCLYEAIPINQYYTDYEVRLSEVQYEVLPAAEVSLIPAGFTHTEAPVSVVSAYERDKPFALLTIVPIFKTADGRYRRLTSATVTITGRQPIAGRAHAKHANRSVLASGNWYNFSITETGIYKVTGADLAALGMGTPITSASLALFGHGGGMLPEANSAHRPEDLHEIPIQIHDGGDGKLDNDDYFLFYGHSPHAEWYDTALHRFTHATNIYADESIYFITNTSGVGQKRRIETINNNHLTANQSVSQYTHFAFYEEDLYNIGNTGKDWFGDLFDIVTSKTYNFTTPNTPIASGKVTVATAGLSNSSSTFTIAVNNSTLGSISMPPLSSNYMARFGKGTFLFSAASEKVSVTLTYSKPSTSSSAYLDWIEVEVPCRLAMGASQFAFCNPSTVGAGNITQFNIDNANANTTIWDVTDFDNVEQQALTNSSGIYSFKVQTDELRQFYAFNGAEFKRISPIGVVQNQNLHATDAVDMVIVAHPSFLSQARRLADFRQSNDGLRVQVVTTQEIYNEFSAGKQDPMAIRDYMKLIYDKTGSQYPKYLLLFGRPSYDFRGRVNGTEIFVPNYQYAARSEGISEYDFYSNDDTFGLLDDDEGLNGLGMYDLAVGRFPASTIAQANTAVDKSITYTTQRNLVEESSSTISNLGDWRNIMAFVADDEDYNDFIVNADRFTQIVEERNPNINLDKIYLDAYQQVSNAGGQRFPEVSTAINNRMERGALFFTYIGHSGKDGWAAERILENSDINRWHNKYNLPMMLTLSCTFGYYDRPELSPAELAFFNSTGGVSAIITSTREAWSSPNNTFGRYIFEKMFSPEQGVYPTIGEIAYTSKNRYGGSASSLAMFVTMGDPSMRLAVPKYNIITDSINHTAVGNSLDTLKALSKVTISGHIADAGDQLLENFNGTIFPSVYDKKVIATTLANDPGSQPFSFTTQKSILFKGNCTVRNGRFNFSFYIPKDIDYNYGNGKVSYYARSSQLQSDAAGHFTDFIIGGTDTNGIADREGPSIELFLNDENFVNGGITDPNPLLIAKIRDNYGINTTGNGIGHNLTATIDQATENQIILNDYYQTEKDSFNMGTVRYNLSELTPGKHTLMVRAWDINNNHSERELAFEVVSDEALTLSHVLNYPNPFTTHTDFYFEQNQTGGMFDIQIQIFTISGKAVRTINTTQYLDGNRSAAIPWDGRDDFGDRIGKGVYMYRLRVRNQNNEIAEKLEKIVIL